MLSGRVWLWGKIKDSFTHSCFSLFWKVANSRTRISKRIWIRMFICHCVGNLAMWSVVTIVSRSPNQETWLQSWVVKRFALWLTGRGLSCFLQSVAMASLLRSALGTTTTLCMAMIFLWCAQQATATRFEVGDAAGWTSFDQQIGKAPDYTAWAASHMILINDTLRQSPFRSSSSFLSKLSPKYSHSRTGMWVHILLSWEEVLMWVDDVSKKRGQQEWRTNSLLLVVGSCKYVKYGEEVALANELEPRCGYLFVMSRKMTPSRLVIHVRWRWFKKWGH